MAARTRGPGPDLELERRARDAGARIVAGVDEVGRGPLAGPVVACAVVLPIKGVPAGLDDSKKLSKAVRERLHDEILACAAVSIAVIDATRIDATNIRIATLEAMTQAVAGLPDTPCHVLVDGVDVPESLRSRGTAVVRGDSTSASIAAASIVAKVHRDRIMAAACGTWPVYGFSRHSGYGTPEHLAAIAAHGASPIHRMSFAPLNRSRVLPGL